MSVAQWLGGQRVTAERLQEMLNKFSDFTPTLALSGAGTPPAYGNATVLCRWSQSGDLVTAHYNIVWGSTSTFGTPNTTNWRIGLPVTAAATTQAAGVIFVEASTSKRYPCRARFTTTTAMELELAGGAPDSVAAAATGIVDGTTPFNWASTNTLKGVIRYEAA
jgi:hypothetical protein